MLVINYKNNTPQQKYYAVGVKQNNNANKIKFVLKANQDGIDLQNLTPYLKLQNKEHTYLDKIELETIYKSANGIIEITWLMTRKSMEYRYLEAQLVFEDNEEDIVWQTLIVELELNETINADEEISDKNPTILQQLQGEVKDVASMRDVLKNIKYEYDEEHDTSRLTMPRGILPLRIVNNPNGNIYYFDYGTKKIIEENGNNQVGVILIWDSIVYLDFYYDVAWEYHESEHEQYAIDYAGLDGDECKLNTYNLYNVPTPEDKNEVLRKITYSYNAGDDETIITFPQYIAPLIFYNESKANDLYFDYDNKLVYDDSKSQVGRIFAIDNNSVIKIGVDGELVADLENDDITFAHFNNFIGINTLNLFKGINNYFEYDDNANMWRLPYQEINFDKETSPVVNGSYPLMYVNFGASMDKGSVETNYAQKGGVVVFDKTSNFLSLIASNTKIYNHLVVSNEEKRPVLIPFSFFSSQNDMNNFIDNINNGGGYATRMYNEKGIVFLKPFNSFYISSRKMIIDSDLEIEGFFIFKGETQGDELEIIGNANLLRYGTTDAGDLTLLIQDSISTKLNGYPVIAKSRNNDNITLYFVGTNGVQSATFNVSDFESWDIKRYS